MRISPARLPPDIDPVKALFTEYAQELGIDLGFQGFDEELRSLPGPYAPPAGALLLGWSGDTAVGVVAMRDLGDGICEMKRMVIRPDHRGGGLGRQLAAAIVAAAQAAGYHSMRLDTLARLRPALDLYASMGFVEIPAYRFNPHHDAVFLELRL